MTSLHTRPFRLTFWNLHAAGPLTCPGIPFFFTSGQYSAVSLMTCVFVLAENSSCLETRGLNRPAGRFSRLLPVLSICKGEREVFECCALSYGGESWVIQRFGGLLERLAISLVSALSLSPEKTHSRNAVIHALHEDLGLRRVRATYVLHEPGGPQTGRTRWGLVR